MNMDIDNLTLSSTLDEPRRILVISPTPTHPITAGNRVRILAMIDALRAMGHEVHFLFIRTESGDDAAMRVYHREQFTSISYTFPKLRRTRFQRVVQAIRQRLDPDSIYVCMIDDWFNDWAFSHIRALQAEKQFDVVLCEYVFFSKALTCFDSGVLKIIDTHDIVGDRHKLFLKAGNQPVWFSTTKEEEGHGLDRADIVIAIQEDECTYFQEITQARTLTIGHLLSVECVYQGTAEQCCLLFVGSQNTINVDAYNYFIKNIFPLIHIRLPEAKLLLAGRICSEVEDQVGVVKLGLLDDLRNAYIRANVVINPSQFGTGLNIKSIEALGYGMPLVTCIAGARGMGSAEAGFLVADTPQAFSEAVVQICLNPALGLAMSAQALKYAKKWNLQNMAALEAMLKNRYR
jgi:glycosyltransferase involved in cell wall biosynthesis